MADKKEPTEDIIENERLEDEEALETVPSEDKIPDKKPKKKKNKKKKDLPASQPTNAVTSMKELFSKLGLEEEKKKSYPFWETQPVPKIDAKVEDYGPFEPDKESVRQDPLTLPDQFVWDTVDIYCEDSLQELYVLLNENYVEDDDNLFRFDYSKDFLKWALTPPGWKKEWHCAVRVASNKKLVGFISAIPAHVRVHVYEKLMVEINFLCVHKKLRSKRMAPVLIKEITRRVNVEGIFQATYTAGVLLPKPVAACRYWHRSLNPKKLVDIQFSQIPRNMTMQRMIRLYKLPEMPLIEGLRPMEDKDVGACCALLNSYLKKFEFTPVYKSLEEFAHWFLPRPKVLESFVVEDPETRKITGMISYYFLPSTVVRHKAHKTLNAVYSFYNVSTKASIKDLMYDALILAKKQDCDVFNALDLMDNKMFLEDLKFGIGDGNLHYYLYNFKCPELTPEQMALVLL